MGIEVDPEATVGDLEKEVGCVSLSFKGEAFDDPAMLLADTGLSQNATIFEIVSPWKPSDDIKIVQEVIAMLGDNEWMLNEKIRDYMMKTHQGRHNVNDFSIENWDMSRVTNMRDLFNENRSFNEDISKWNVSNVRNMSWMFHKATSFNQDISRWDVSNVESMTGMFWFATSFNQDIGGWVVSEVDTMYYMFAQAYSFNQDISQWNVPCARDGLKMFFGATTLKDDFKPPETR